MNPTFKDRIYPLPKEILYIAPALPGNVRVIDPLPKAKIIDLEKVRRNDQTDPLPFKGS